MAKIAIGGVFNQFGSASEAIDQLVEHGIRRSQISVASEASTYDRLSGSGGGSSRFKTVDLRGVGPSVAAGPVAREVTPTGDLKKWLEQVGMAKQTSQKMVTALRSGHTLVVLHVEEDQAEDALQLFSGTHGSGGGITGGVAMSAGFPALRKQLRESQHSVKPPRPQGSGTHGSGGGITGRQRKRAGGSHTTGGTHGPGKGIED
jgi:hypothetical protein